MKTDRRAILRWSAIAGASTVAAGVAGAGNALTALAAPAPQAGSLKEAPSLGDQVRSGRLPAVDQRLPANPRVVKPLERAGRYGGTWHRAYLGLSDRVGPTKLQEEQLIEWDAPNPTTLGLVPNFIEKWDQNATATEFTFYLRAGTKWSDGSPVTTDDVRFWWEDYQMTPEITPAPSFLVRQRVNGEYVIAKLDIIDQNTFKVTYAAPYPLLPIQIAKSGGGLPAFPGFIAPSAYLKQFHPKYADVNQLNQLAASKNLPGWAALWGTAGDQQGPINWWFVNPDLPVLNPWKTTVPAPGDPHVMERNPYYWQVDTAGNQLPYVDRVEHALYQDAQVLNLWIAQGKIDEQGRGLSAGSYTFYKENEARGKYRTLRWRAASTGSYFPNQNVDDPGLRALFAAPEFRQALNVSINRDEINNLVWNGLGKPRQASPVNGSPEYDAEFERKWVEYNPDQANALLDGLGLARGADGMRRRPDGQPVEWVVEHTSVTGSPDLDQHEFVRRYWEAVGLKVTFAFAERTLYQNHVNDGNIQMGYWGYDRLSVIKADPGRWTATITDGPWAPRWGNWYAASPNQKEEPPADHPIRQVWALWDQAQVQADDATRNATFQQLLNIHKAAPYVVGVVGELVAPYIVQNTFHNFPDGMISDDTLRDDGLVNPQQFFIQ
ncbi:MAG TPA: ABC transporter substrate-binding protein [Chloroflexota bacterium]|nr:ABC transporter substrate-binding protein [Chloroflexota bacterium]